MGTEYGNDIWPLIELTNRYFRGVDLADEEILRTCLSTDVMADHTIVGRVAGIDNFIKVVRNLPSEIISLQHYLTNHEVDVNGTAATVRASLLAQHMVRDNGAIVLMPGGGRYTFECRKTDRGWRIARLRNDVTWADPRLYDIFSPK